MNRQPRPTVTSYPPRSIMHKALNTRFVGLDIEGQNVSGLIWHVGNYDKANGKITTYVLQIDPNGHNGKTAIVSADAVHEHLKGLALIASMEADNE